MRKVTVSRMRERHAQAVLIFRITYVSYTGVYLRCIYGSFPVWNQTNNIIFICFLLGNSPAPEFYMPSFRISMFHLHRRVGMKFRESIPKRRHIKFSRRIITQKKTYSIQNTAKVWNQQHYFWETANSLQGICNMCGPRWAMIKVPQHSHNLFK